METLIDEVREEHEGQRGKALEVYRGCLMRADAPEPGDKLKMVKVMDVLGFSPERLEADLRVVQRAKKLTEQARDFADEDRRQELQAKSKVASDVLNAFDAETAQIVRERKAKSLELYADFTTHSQRLSRAHSAVLDLQRLREANRELFGLPALPPPPPVQHSQTLQLYVAPPPGRENKIMPIVNPRHNEDGSIVYGAASDG